MDRQRYLDLAAAGHRVPIGADLVLHEQPDAEAVMLDGARLGKVVIDAARRYNTPLALPLMDLRIEKSLLLQALGVPVDQIDQFHFSEAPTDEQFAQAAKLDVHADARAHANVEAIRYVAAEKDLIACGMAIGPFSLMTKLIADPITPVFMAGMGTTAEEDPEVKLVERLLELATAVIEKSLLAQFEAGAAAICVCEPAANQVFFSPNQMQAGADVFDRYVMAYNRRIKALFDRHGVDLIFHDCGELIDVMIEKFVTLDPAILSLGSSRKLWEDARLVPNSTVLYGNLPSKKFYSDKLVSVDDVRRMTTELEAKIRTTGKPFILGTECDVLSVSGCADTIKAKVAAMLDV
jgi:uroporphyrinogen-III decarboxylase